MTVVIGLIVLACAIGLIITFPWLLLVIGVVIGIALLTNT